MSVRGRPPYEYEVGAHENSLKIQVQRCGMLSGARQAGFQGNKLPPLAFVVGSGQSWPSAHLSPHPGHLPLCVAAGLPLGAIDGGREVSLAPQMSGEFAQADRLHRRKARIEATRSQGRDLVQHTLFDHGPQSGVAAGVERLARRLQGDRPPRPGGKGGGAAPLPFGQRPTGGGEHLPGPDQPLPVARADALCGGGVDLRQAGAERRLAEGVEIGVGRSAHFRRDIRRIRKALGEGAEIETGASDDDDVATSRGDLGQRFVRRPQPAADRPAVGGVRVTEEVVRRPRLFLVRGSRAQQP